MGVEVLQQPVNRWGPGTGAAVHGLPAADDRAHTSTGQRELLLAATLINLHWAIIP
ncbi:MAG TPA: hypothetical protein VNB87_02245 [Propionibacteriaceae bacterium]|nr:hypothetical protein [Propionibacteriaceae bacterium]